MGRWTPEYNDRVLTTKLKGLVVGAIKRRRLEAEPTISYEAFVDSLDEGDSFTTTLFEVLVTELAYRKTRDLVGGRHLIEDYTAKTLRNLASSNRIYRERSCTHSRNRVSETQEDAVEEPSEFIARFERPYDDDIEIESLEDFAGIESISQDDMPYSLHDSHPDTSASRPRRPLSSQYPDIYDPSDTSSTSPYSYGFTPSSYLHPTNTVDYIPPILRNLNATSLTRQSSIRRPTRSRTIDFNEFAARRRTNYRQQNLQVPDLSYSSVTGVVPAMSTTSDLEALRSSTMHTNPSRERLGLRNRRRLSDAFSRYQEDRTDAHDHTLRLRRGGISPPEALSMHRVLSPVYAERPIFLSSTANDEVLLQTPEDTVGEENRSEAILSSTRRSQSQTWAADDDLQVDHTNGPLSVGDLSDEI